jgi:hypothetical protein
MRNRTGQITNLVILAGAPVLVGCTSDAEMAAAQAILGRRAAPFQWRHRVSQ